ncbi:MAG: hypothetical protein ACXWKC_14840 [Xanthobacteraceae bacterium]
MTRRPRRPPLRPVIDAEIDAAISETLAETIPPTLPVLHDLFNQQVREVMDDAGLSEDDKQSVLVAMACPCCGGGVGSFTYKLRPKG